jgi:hypothetical protein
MTWARAARSEGKPDAQPRLQPAGPEGCRHHQHVLGAFVKSAYCPYITSADFIRYGNDAIAFGRMMLHLT